MPVQGFWFRTALVVLTFALVIFLVDTFRRVWDFAGDLFLVLFLAYLVGSLIIHTVRSLMHIPGMKRPIAIGLVYLVLIGIAAFIVLVVLPATVTQALDLVDVLPGYLERLPGFVERVERELLGYGIEIDLLSRFQVESINERIEALGQMLTDQAFNILQSVVAIVFAMSLVIVISFYIVLDGGRRLDEALKVLPPRAERETRFVLRTIDETFRGYLRGMLLISLIYGVGTASVMLAVGLPAALPVALISSLLLAVPFVGDWLALVLPLIVAATSGDFIKLLIVLGVLLFIQQVMLNLLSPRILGSSVRMPAMLVVVAVVVGARLTGITGALLGVPTMGVIYTLAVHYGVVIRRLRDIRERSARSRRAMEARRARASREVTDATRSEPVALPEPVDPAGSEPERAPLIEWTEFPADWVSGETTQAEPVASAEAEDSAEGETEQAEPVASVGAEDSAEGETEQSEPVALAEAEDSAEGETEQAEPVAPVEAEDSAERGMEQAEPVVSAEVPEPDEDPAEPASDEAPRPSPPSLKDRFEGTV